MSAASEAIMSENNTGTDIDLIIETSVKIESLTSVEAFERIPTLLEGIDYANFELGGILCKIRDEGWWKEKGYESFKACIENATGLHYRKAMYLMTINERLVESEIPWSTVAPVGWTKLKELVDILTPENVDEWVEKIVGPPGMTTIQIQEAVRAVKEKLLGGDSNQVPQETSSLSTVTFKLHPDQKVNIRTAIDKAKGEAGTEFDSVALDAICMNYLAGGKVGKQKVVKPKSLSETFKAYAPEEVLESFAVTWPDIDVTAKM